MKIYIAARYGRRLEMKRHAEELKMIGHKVVSTWVFEDNDAVDAQFRSSRDASRAAQGFAEKNLDQIDECDIFVCFTEAPEGGPEVGGGRHVELGYAIASKLGAEAEEFGSDMDIILIGPPENLFCHFAWMRRFLYWPDALVSIGAASLVARQ